MTGDLVAVVIVCRNSKLVTVLGLGARALAVERERAVSACCKNAISEFAFFFLRRDGPEMRGFRGTGNGPMSRRTISNASVSNVSASVSATSFLRIRPALNL
jgi:hypothetical protein